jgi:biotin carboxylase
MNVICFDLPNCNFNNLISLYQAGHTVYLVTQADTSYLAQKGITILTDLGSAYTIKPENLPEIRTLVSELDIEVMIVTMPTLGFLHTEFADTLTYIGPSEQASRLETDRIFAKQIARDAKVKTPEELHRCSKSEFDSTLWPKPLIIKPTTLWQSAVIVHDGQDDLLSEYLDNTVEHEIYVEEFITDKIETNVFFVIVNNEFKITHTQQITGEDRNKTIGQDREWYYDTHIEPLYPETDIIVRSHADRLLSEIAKLGGCYEGSLCGFLTHTGDWYLAEINVRPDIQNSVPTMDNWLTAMTSNIDLIRSQQFIKVIPTLTDPNLASTERYPMELHDKYQVYPPTSLTSDYLTTSGSCMVVSTNRLAMDAYVSELESTTNFRVNRPY